MSSPRSSTESTRIPPHGRRVCASSATTSAAVAKSGRLLRHTSGWTRLPIRRRRRQRQHPQKRRGYPVANQGRQKRREGTDNPGGQPKRTCTPKCLQRRPPSPPSCRPCSPPDADGSPSHCCRSATKQNPGHPATTPPSPPRRVAASTDWRWPPREHHRGDCAAMSMASTRAWRGKTTVVMREGEGSHCQRRRCRCRRHCGSRGCRQQPPSSPAAGASSKGRQNDVVLTTCAAASSTVAATSTADTSGGSATPHRCRRHLAPPTHRLSRRLGHFLDECPRAPPAATTGPPLPTPRCDPELEFEQ